MLQSIQKHLYFCKRHHITIFYRCTHFERADHFASFYKGHGSFHFYLPINSRKRIEMPYVDRMQKVQSKQINAVKKAAEIYSALIIM